MVRLWLREWFEGHLSAKNVNSVMLTTTRVALVAIGVG